MTFFPEYIKHQSEPKFGFHALLDNLESPYTKECWDLSKKSVVDLEMGVYCIEIEKFNLNNFFETIYFVNNTNGIFSLLAYDECWKISDNDFSFNKKELGIFSKSMGNKLSHLTNKEDNFSVSETSLCMANIVNSVKGLSAFFNSLEDSIITYDYKIKGRFKL